MMQRKLELNLIQHQPWSLSYVSWLNVVMVTLSLVLTAALFWRYEQQKTAVLSEITHLQQLTQQTKPIVKNQSARQYSQDELSLIKRILTETNVPWNLLLDDLENISQENVYLLEVYPDPKKKTVMLLGQAKALPDVFSYIDALSTSNSLQDVYLQKHAVKPPEANRLSVDFTIHARWRNE